VSPPKAEPPSVAIVSEGVPIDIVENGGSATAVIWPGMGSRWRTMHRIELEAGGATRPLRHESEAVYFVAEGSGRIAGQELRRHHMVYVPRDSTYRFEADTPMLVWGGPCPPDLSLYGEAQPLSPDAETGSPPRLFDSDADGVPLPMIGKRVRLVVWPGVGADIATMNFAILEPGEQNTPHAHSESDDVIAILEGEASIDNLDTGETHDFSAGDVVFVRAGVRHMVKCDKGVPLMSAGGPCPPDYDMLRALGLA
jgi:mannose-6-phosphate isomerase-like protein (cupin superfamily)